MSSYCPPQWTENGHVYRESDTYPGADVSGCVKPTHDWTQPGSVRSEEQHDSHLCRSLRTTNEDSNTTFVESTHAGGDGNVATIRTSDPHNLESPVSPSHLSCKLLNNIPKCPDNWNTAPTSEQSCKGVLDHRGPLDNGRTLSQKKQDSTSTERKPHECDDSSVNATATGYDAVPVHAGVEPYLNPGLVCNQSGVLGTSRCPNGPQAQIISQRQLDRIVFEHSYSTAEPLVSKPLCEPEGDSVIAASPPNQSSVKAQLTSQLSLIPEVAMVTSEVPLEKGRGTSALLPHQPSPTVLCSIIAPPAQLLPLAPSVLSMAPSFTNSLLDNFSLDLDTEPDSSSDDDMISAGQQALLPLTTSVACSTPSLSTVCTRSASQVGRAEYVAANHIQLRNGRILPSMVGHTSPSKKAERCKETVVSSELLSESSVSSCESVSDDLEHSLKMQGKGVQPRPSKTKRQLNKTNSASHYFQNYKTKKGSRKQSSVHKKERVSLSTEEHGKPKPQKPKKPFKDFEPEILQTRSRAETATLRRRKEMEIEMEQHELERSQSVLPAVPVDTCTEQQEEGRGDYVQEGRGDYVQEGRGDYAQEGRGDCVQSVSETTQSSMVSFREVESKPMDDVSMHSKEVFPPELIAQCRKVMPARSSGDTALHKVCRNGKYDMARCLIFLEGIDTNSQDHAGWTPLHEAVSGGHVRVAQLLLDNGADPNLSATDGTRPINDAIEIGSLELVKLLVQYGADPTAEFGEKTPLEHAISFERTDIVEFLEGIVKRRNKSKISIKHPSVGRKTITKQKKEENEERGPPSELPIDGYSASGPSLGPELDCPLFYISPIVEMCDKPLLPIYNLEVVSGCNARRHNFHILRDILPEMGLETTAQFHELYPHMQTHTMAAKDVLSQLRNSTHNQLVSHSWDVHCSNHCASSSDSIELVPLCNELRSLLGIQVTNMDD